jgi:hypothetical protein
LIKIILQHIKQNAPRVETRGAAHLNFLATRNKGEEGTPAVSRINPDEETDAHTKE